MLRPPLEDKVVTISRAQGSLTFPANFQLVGARNPCPCSNSGDPVNSVHRTDLMAIERDDLQNLIFDNRVLWNHRALAAMMGVGLRLPPIQQVLANRQVRSRCLEYLITHIRSSS